MTTFSLYRQAQLSSWSGRVNWSGGAITATLHRDTYIPDLDADQFVSDLSGELITGAGYTLGGKVLTGRSSSYITAADWPTAWKQNTAYAAGQVVCPLLNPVLLFRCYAPGTSGNAAPAWPDVPGASVGDGSAAWSAIGSGAVALKAATLSWPSFTGAFRYIVISDRSAPAAADQPLIALADMEGTATGTGGNLDVLFDSGGGSGIVIPLWAT
jgi:hypothetical protein